MTRTLPGPASIAYVFGTVLLALLGVQVVSGIALAAFYAPSTTDAWASVAYLEDQASLGWFVRALHSHGTSALVVIAGLHLVQTAVAGAYQRPREVVWWLGLLLLVLVLAWSVTGYWLRWDQAAYWAAKVELGIAEKTPVIGGAIARLVLGGNDAGNLTLTRAYALHVGLVPALFGLVLFAHIKLARRHGVTPARPRKEPLPSTARVPAQTLRDAIASAIVIAVLLAFTAQTGSIGLAAPADPGVAHDARPLWPFRWLFELRALAGSAEAMVALVAPAIVGGVLAALPFLDRGPDKRPRKRVLALGLLAGVLALIAGLTVMSFARDANDPGLAPREAKATAQAARARRLAKTYGVPASGPLDVYEIAPHQRAHTLFHQQCEGCHGEKSEKRKAPSIGLGHADRAWIAAFLKQPSGDAFWGRTKLAKGEDAMPAIDLPPGEMADVVELMYAQSGAVDVDSAKRERGMAIFEKTCSDCHSLDEGVSASGPALAGFASRSYYGSFISHAGSGLHMGKERSEMPRFDTEMSLADRDALAAYLVWLRTASPADLSALDMP